MKVVRRKIARHSIISIGHFLSPDEQAAAVSPFAARDVVVLLNALPEIQFATAARQGGGGHPSDAEYLRSPGVGTPGHLAEPLRASALKAAASARWRIVYHTLWS